MLLILFQKYPTVSGITGEKNRKQIGGNLEAERHVVLLLERAAAILGTGLQEHKPWQRDTVLTGLESYLLPETHSQDIPARKPGSLSRGQGMAALIFRCIQVPSASITITAKEIKQS